MTRDEILQLNDEELAAHCELKFVKGSGNGGQKRNKTSSAVQLKLKDFPVTASDCQERSQHRNRSVALAKLRKNLALTVRETPAQLPPRPECSMEHPEYPLFLARLLDLLTDCNFEPKLAAEKWGCSTSSLVKKLRRDPAVWVKVQVERLQRGLFPLNGD